MLLSQNEDNDNLHQDKIYRYKAKEDLETIKEAMSLLIAKLDPETRDKLLKLVKS